MELLWFVLTGYGLTQLLVYGSIFNKPRNFIKSRSDFFGELVSCPMCMGFWVGVFLFGLNPFTELFNFELNLVNLLICGWLGSGSSYVMNMVFTDKGVGFFHNHNDPVSDTQGCESCKQTPYGQMNLDEVQDFYYNNGGYGNEQE